MDESPVLKDLVLIGGGHSHVAVLRRFGMRPIPGLRLTLISRHFETPYSGMLPGFVAGRYARDDVHIDLVPLCRFAGARFIEAEVNGLDIETNRVLIAGRPSLGYDVVSINCGSTPSIGAIALTSGDLVRVKPIDEFLTQWERLRTRVEDAARPMRVGIVGGGAGGVELLLAIEERLRPWKDRLRYCLVTADSTIVPTHSAGVRRRLANALAAAGIEVHTRSRVVERTASGVILENGQTIELDEVVVVTNAAAAAWIGDSGLTVDEQGFMVVDRYLRSVSVPNVFGAGDAVAMRASPRPKSGVFAVRQGRPLAHNLRCAILERPLRPYRPQRHFLSLIGTGGARAVASRGWIAAEAHWIWLWKDRIDRAFMRRFTELPPMHRRTPTRIPRALRARLPQDIHTDGMRCGGCGAKLGADALAGALGRLKVKRHTDVLVGLDRTDDGAVVAIPEGQLTVLSIDGFRPLVNDPHLFGRIVANHCLNDLFAVGALPHTALAIVTLPHWPEDKLADELLQMLAGASEVFDREGAALVGGHTGEGAEINLGFSVTGLVAPGEPLLKKGLAVGDRLILTKPLGTGALFAAAMRGRARGAWLHGAIETMLQSNGPASACLREHGATAVTDVTGFGLAGHLAEMLADAAIACRLQVASIPVLAGARQCIEAGWRSTLHDRNAAAVERLFPAEPGRATPSIVFDPQTAGGLLAGVPSARASDCVAALQGRGYLAATVIGTVTARHAGAACISLDES